MKRCLLILLIACMLLPTAIAETPAAGDIVVFGSYEQDNNLENGPEPIEWRVLLCENGEALLIAVMGLDAAPYHDGYEDVTWEKCTLRAWLNGPFLSAAFSGDERALLVPSVLANEDNTSFRTPGGAGTEDLVYILSASECKKLLTPAANRTLLPTAYAEEMGVYPMTKGKYTGNCWWWVRTPGNLPDMAAYAKEDGTIFYKGIDVDFLSAAVRPVIRIRLPQPEGL